MYSEPLGSEAGALPQGSCEVSSSLEKVLEYRFLAELSAELWRRGVRGFEVLRGDVDAHGYDLVIDAAGCLRHIQLKAMVRKGRRRNVSVNLRLAQKPSGCVIWMMYDQDTLDVGPWLWFGSAPGMPLPDPGGRIARHSKANALGVKADRAQHRLISRSRFELKTSIGQLAEALFPLSGNAPGVRHMQILRRYLASGPKMASGSWLEAVRCGDFSAIPDPLTWDRSVEFAHLVDGYAMAAELGALNPGAYLEKMRPVDGEGRKGSPAELWTCLFLEHRRWRMGGMDPPASAERELDQLCATLRQSLLPIPSDNP